MGPVVSSVSRSRPWGRREQRQPVETVGPDVSSVSRVEAGGPAVSSVSRVETVGPAVSSVSPVETVGPA